MALPAPAVVAFALVGLTAHALYAPVGQPAYCLHLARAYAELAALREGLARNA